VALSAAPSNGEETPSVPLCIFVPSTTLSIRPTVFAVVGIHTGVQIKQHQLQFQYRRRNAVQKFNFYYNKLAVAKEKLLQNKRLVELQERRKVQEDRRILEEEVQSSLVDYMKYQQQLVGGHLVEGTTQHDMVNSMVEYYEEKWRNTRDAISKRMKEPRIS
jgi:hypothetical protein